MIKRYSRKELTDIWSEENKYKIWLDVEVAAAEAMEKLGQIPRGVASVVRKKARINVSRIHKIESEVKHDVIAFLTSVTEKAGIKARYLHQGMTSSDVLDTSFNIQLVQSGKIILKDIDQILKVLKNRSACLLANHGQISTASNLDSAFELAQEVENLSLQYINALRLGKPRILSNKEIKIVLGKMKNYKKG